jgi:N utilization substance protein A
MVDITSDTVFALEEAEAALGGEDDADSVGRCTAILSTGKRCPNTALPGSRFCGVAAHQELATREARGEDISDQVVQPMAEADEEAEELVDGEAAVELQAVEGYEEDGPAAA